MARWADSLKRITPPNELRYSGLYTAEWLNQWRQQCDPLADAAYAALAAHGRQGGDMLGEIEALARSGNSDCRAFLDEVICQEDLAITLSLFSYTNIRSLLRLGIRLSRDEIDSHHHMWKYAGWLLGIREELLTDSIEQEKTLWDAFVKHAARPELLGPEVKQVLDAVAEAAPTAPETVRQFLYEMTRYLAGEEYTESFDLPGKPNYIGIPAAQLAGFGVSTIAHSLPLLPEAWSAFVAKFFLGQMENLDRSRGMDYDVKVDRAEDPKLRQGLKDITTRI